MGIIYKYIFASSVLEMILHSISTEISTGLCLFAEIGDIYVYSCIYKSIMSIYYLEYILILFATLY